DGDLEPKVLDARWTGNSSIITILQAPKWDRKRFGDNYMVAPAAVGHFTLDDNHGNKYRFTKYAYFVNEYTEINTAIQNHQGENPVNVESIYGGNFNIQRGATVRVEASYLCENKKSET
ncbi:7680_t:CDS:1, partial [Racocetra fulgida]